MEIIVSPEMSKVILFFLDKSSIYSPSTRYRLNIVYKWLQPICVLPLSLQPYDGPRVGMYVVVVAKLPAFVNFGTRKK